MLQQFSQRSHTISQLSRALKKYFLGKKATAHHQGAAEWMCTLILVPTPQRLEAILELSLRSLACHKHLGTSTRTAAQATGCWVCSFSTHRSPEGTWRGSKSQR